MTQTNQPKGTQKNEGANTSSPATETAAYNNIIGLLIFMAFLTIPYIYNSHLTDRKYRKTEKIKAEMNELRSEFITLKSEIVGENKQSDIAKKLKHRGIKELTESPIDLNAKRER
jgi:Bacteriodetes cell division protein (FtsL-like)